jgi:hypothetical protein
MCICENRDVRRGANTDTGIALKGKKYDFHKREKIWILDKIKTHGCKSKALTISLSICFLFVAPPPLTSSPVSRKAVSTRRLD